MSIGDTMTCTCTPCPLHPRKVFCRICGLDTPIEMAQTHMQAHVDDEQRQRYRAAFVQEPGSGVASPPQTLAATCEPCPRIDWQA